ncbi:MAG TPA: hypothetical protein VFG05_09140 [Methylocella sp.]|nr:hypothetical protein [Methylocella sp.]
MLLPCCLVALLFTGIVLSVPIASYDSFITPCLALRSPAMTKDIEESSLETPALAFRIFFVLHLLLFSLFSIVLGIFSLKTSLIPRLAGIFIALGAPIFWLGALVFSGNAASGNAVPALGAMLYGLGFMRLGWALSKEKRMAAAA